MRAFLNVLLLIAATATEVSAMVKLPNVFSDNMVLQRGRPIVIWGWADPHEKIRVKLHKQDKIFSADRDGKWKVVLLPERWGGPYELVVAGKNVIQLKDIMIGDVWVTAGHSSSMYAMLDTWGDGLRQAAVNSIEVYSVFGRTGNSEHSAYSSRPSDGLMPRRIIIRKNTAPSGRVV